MRKSGIIFFIALFSLADVKAQTQVFIVGGINSTDIKMRPELVSTNLSQGNAWQIGASLQFPIEGKTFLYTGLFYQTHQTGKSYSECCFIHSEETYHPQFINLPFGAGLKLPLGKKLSIQFSGGGYFNFAIGGKLDGVYLMGDIIVPKPIYVNRNISYGGSNVDDMLAWNWGLQAGTAIHWSKFGFQFRYSHGMSKIVPRKDAYASSDDQKYRTLQFDLMYRLFTSKK